MTIEIPQDILDKLEHQIPEIRERAIKNVQSKFHSCRVDLDDLNVNVQLLIRRLIDWFDLKPVTHEKQIFDILLTLLKSKFKPHAVRLLTKCYKTGELQKIRAFANDKLTSGCFAEIIDILNSSQLENHKSPIIEHSKPAETPKICDNWDFKDVNANRCSIEGLKYEQAWEVPGQIESTALSTLKSSISLKHSQSEIDHALQFFEKYVYDFPGEFFLQTPFIFTNLLQLIESEIKNFDHTPALTCCLKLTQNLSRRVTIRRVASMCTNSKEHVTKQQVTIASYCFTTFQAVLNLLRNIYADSNLARVNECFLILIEIVELICKTAGTYSIEIGLEYRIDQIIEDLADFLRFIREITSNYRRNGQKTNRNNSISILFLICHLLMFKESDGRRENENFHHEMSEKQNESANDLDISQRIRKLSLKSERRMFESIEQLDLASNTTDDAASVSTLTNYVTATEHLHNSTWRKELETALLDYPLKHFYPQINELIFYALKIDSLPDNNPMKVLMNLTELFEPVVTLLRDPKMCSAQQILAYGLKSLDVLTIVKSDELTYLFFNAITNLTSKSNSDQQLHEDAEKLLLHMMSYGCPDTKRLTYKLTSEKMSLFFGSVMDGKQIMPKCYALNPSYLFGLPLSTEIIAEVLCNGLSCEDSKTANYAENILLLVLRIKDVLPQHWKEMSKFLIPVLPLILCYAKTTTKLGTLVLSVVEPDTRNHLPTITLIKSSVALLFSRDTHTQGEAIYRLTYLIQNMPKAEMYMPNMRSISDTIPSNICIVEPMEYSSNEEFSCLYDVHLIEDFLAVLQNPNTEPSIRHSTLKQLNVIAMDPIVLSRFYEIDGYSVIWSILDKSLQDASSENYAKNVVEIIGILSKMCIRIPSFRRQWENDIETYVLILRSLLLFHTEEKFKKDCAVLLFTLAYGGYVVGGNKHFIVPSVCRKLMLPIGCEFSWKSSSDRRNLLDLLPISEKPSKLADTNSNHSSDSHSDVSSANSTIKVPEVWRYIRMTFSALWFGSLDQLIDCPMYLEGTKNTELNYKMNKDSLRFNKALCVTASDLEVIEGSSQKYGLNYWLKQLKNATNTTQVSLSCAAIENFSNVDSTGHRKQWDCNLFLQSIKRFCTVAPNYEQDEIVFTKICRLLSNLVERDFVDVHIWVLKEFNRKGCIYVDLINDPRASATTFQTNIKFLEAILAKTIDNDSKKIIQNWVFTPMSDDKRPTTIIKGKNKSKTKPKNLYEHFFDIALLRLDSLLEEKKMDQLRCLVSFIQLLASSGLVQDNDYEASYASNKLLKLALGGASASYVGSNFSKQCLLAIGNMMCHIDELRIEKKYLTFLSTLCGHTDFQIRTYSWSILLKIASTLPGAEQLVQEMNSLPGGLFSCSLSTLLDDTESAIVRENAALVFAALISHRQPNNELENKLYPKNATDFGYEWIGILLHHHNLIRKIIASIEYLHVDDMIDTEKKSIGLKIVPCNLMRSYCIVLNSLLPLKGASDLNQIFMTMLEICKTIPQIAQSINQSSMLLLSEICGLMSHCMSYKKSLIDQITRELDVVQSLIAFLNVDLFENISKPVKLGCWANILKVLRRLAISPVGFQIICEAFAQDPEHLEDAVSLFFYGLSSKDVNIPVMRFIIDLMIISQTTVYPFETFAEQLNELRLSERVKESTKKFIFSAAISSQLVVNWTDSSDVEESDDGTFATEILFGQLAELFELKFSNMSSIKSLTATNREKCFEYTCKSLETLLKCSDKARAIATGQDFVLTVVYQMGEVCDNVGGSFTEFVRKNGNAKLERPVNKLKLLLRIILCWYSADCLQNDTCTQPFISMCHKLWPSIGVDAELQNIFMKMLLFVSNNSLPACKAISSTPPFSVNSAAFLNSIIEYCTSETSKPKTGHANMEVLQTALKIVTNCCSCVEGRMLIAKTRMLHTLTRLHPQVTRNHKPWPQLTIHWLTLFEVFTRYPDSSREAHMNLLCNVAESQYPKNRRLALEILRNMTFNTDNRAALLSSPDFQRVMYSVLDKDELGDEQLLIAVSIWKLVANSSKGKNAIKNSPIMSKLRALKETIDRQTGNQLRTHRHISDSNDIYSGDETTEELEVAVKCALDILQK